MQGLRRRGISLLVSVLLAACSTPFASSRAPGSVGPTATARPSVPAPSSPRTASPSADVAADPPALALELVARGFDAPIGIAPAPGGGLLINERVGRVIALDPSDGSTAPLLDITDRVLGGGEQGLLGLVLDPDWPAMARAFVQYSDRNGDTVVSEFRAMDPSNPAALDPASERPLLRVDQPYANHNGGQLAFGPDGYLYIGLGDGGSGGDPEGNGQDRHSLLGKILRIDPEPPDDTNDSIGYGIPGDNPFADGVDGAPEVFAYGLRNPWRFSFDTASGQLWIGDVGQNAFEEIDRIDPATDAGANLGWNTMEASHCFADPACDPAGLVLPVAEYGRDLGCSVSGGYVYRGESIPALRGRYLFSDYCTGLLFGVPSDGEGVQAPRTLLQTGASVSTFGQGADGELYLADLNSGSIYRIVAGD